MTDDDLPQRVDAELAAWSYSIAHDLRSPLRAISGFSQMLAEDYGDKLDEDGLEYLQRVRAAAERMEQLIEDFRKLGQVSRGEVRRVTVDLSAMAEEIAGALRERNPERAVEFRIEPGLTVEGDPALLQLALESLFANSWKFTSRHPTARIEMGRQEHGGDRVLFIRDDGAGFDPAYGDKLFIPFQRLHGQAEFEGVGIGLALVRRIVHRHRGRVWAEGAVEQGATIYILLESRT